MFSVKRKINVTVASLSGFQPKLYSMISKPEKKKKSNDQRRVCGKFLDLLLLSKPLPGYLIVYLDYTSFNICSQAFSFLKANRTGLHQTPKLLKKTCNHQREMVSAAYLYKLTNISSRKSWVNLFAQEKMATDT